MALTPQNSEAFMREVDEAVRQDQLLTFWQRYGRLLLAAIILGLAGFGGWLYWQHYSKTQSEAVSEKMDSVLTTAVGGGTPDAKQLDMLADASQPGYRASALLTKAGLASRKGDAGTAITLYRAMVADKGLDQPYRDLALIRQTALEFDSLTPQQVVDRLKPLAIEGTPWFGSAGELVALAYMKMGKTKMAGPMFAAMAKDANVPDSIRSRARQMAGVMGIDAVENPAESTQAESTEG
ncbi:tetratricopeptide repeat protein [Sphingobium sp. HBC34]|uniref:Tetratricopeptide repeat protein n=1 Tax=Sphingobium cyanobacteriorum TaxID=3063954 RepID=A0ABT8ZIC2_9SPHN|nr:tetratricopeptide repeat protein [Sphingobium sp. HBC34]MDO7833961.1 tetratricopeptide repeat protein [Sphingobium sp. HBC34]